MRKSCQLGIMGVAMDDFLPDDLVTRKQFGTMLSRVLRGDKFENEGGLYYELHLRELNRVGIMNKIDNPSIEEVRGWVMLMLMRVEDKILKGEL